MREERVVITRLPERLRQSQANAFCQEIQPLLRGSRPYLVFDFADVAEIDAAGVEVLLNCIGEAMKSNGDIKFACVSPSVGTVLELMGVDHLFEIFETTGQAVESFHSFAPPITVPVALPLRQNERVALQ